MRIIKFLLISTLIMTIVGGVGFLILREAMLIWGMSHLRTSVGKMRNISVNVAPYVKECQKRGETDLSQNVIDRIQLRFTTNRDYQLEVVCRQFQLDPMVVDAYSLPPLLTKAAGTSGLIWNQPLSSITLSIWGRQRSLILEETDVSYTNDTPNTPLGSGPVTSCQGYGFSCCQQESTQGVGDLITVAADCPKTCYASCVSRPIVLSFSSEPFFDPKTRSLTVDSGELVTFSYVVDMGAAKTGTMTLDYGDGTSDQLTELVHTLDHQYVCQRGNCQFTAKLSATDSQNVSSMATPVTALIINVNPN